MIEQQQGPTLGVRFREFSALKRIKNITEEQQGPQYSSQIVEKDTVSCELHSLFIITFTHRTLVPTQMCTSPSQMLSHAYFGALRRM